MFPRARLPFHPEIDEALLRGRTALGILPSPVALAQTFWAIDPVAGSDSNPGTLAAPLRTAGRYFALTGLFRPVSAPTTIALVNDLPASDPLVLSNFYATPTAQVAVVDGAPKVLASGTLTSQIAFNSKATPSGQLQVVTDTSRASWASFVGKIFKITSGVAAGATAIVIADLGGGSASVSVITRVTPVNPSTYTAISIVGNETYQVLERRAIGALIVDDAAPFTWWLTQNPSVPPLTFSQIKFPQAAPQAITFFEHGVLIANDCDVSGLTVLPPAHVFLNSCYSSSAAAVESDGTLREFYGWHNGTAFFITSPGIYDTTTTIFNGGSITFIDGGLFEAHHEIGVYNANRFFNVMDGATVKLRHGVFGSGNTDCLIFVQAGKVLTEAVAGTSDFPVTGTGGGYQDIKFANLTNAGTPQTSLPAMDSSTYTLTAARQLTFANYFATITGGGFNQSIFDPAAPSNAMYASNSFA